MASDRCLVCGSSKVRIAFTKNAIDYARCESCDFLFSLQQSNPNFENTMENFEPTYREYFEDKIADQKHATNMLSWISTHASIRDKRVLDVGCGSGKFVNFLRGHSIEAEGLEASAPLFQEYLANVSWFTHSSVEDYARLNHRYSVITLFDVLEHVDSPRKFLRSIWELLEKNGWLFISTPNLSSLAARLTGRHWHFVNKYHLSLFSQKAVQTLLDPLFEIKQTTTFGKNYPVSYLMRYAGTFLFNRNWRIPDWVGEVHLYLNTRDTMYVAAQRR